MRFPRVRVIVRRLAVAVAGVAVLLLLAGFVEGLTRPIRSHNRGYERVQRALMSLKNRRPPEVSEQRWAYAVGWTLNALGNCGSYPAVGPYAMEGLADELEGKLRGEVDMGTIDRVWDEFVRISPVGKSYDRFRPTRHGRLEEADIGFTWAWE